MTSAPGATKKPDVGKVLKAAVDAGLKVARCEIDRDGRMIIVFTDGNDDKAPGKAEDIRGLV